MENGHNLNITLSYCEEHFGTNFDVDALKIIEVQFWFALEDLIDEPLDFLLVLIALVVADAEYYSEFTLDRNRSPQCFY